MVQKRYRLLKSRILKIYKWTEKYLWALVCDVRMSSHGIVACKAFKKSGSKWILYVVSNRPSFSTTTFWSWPPPTLPVPSTWPLLTGPTSSSTSDLQAQKPVTVLQSLASLLCQCLKEISVAFVQGCWVEAWRNWRSKDWSPQTISSFKHYRH